MKEQEITRLGRAVLADVSIDDFSEGEHQFYFQASSNGLGEPILLPVILKKGSKEGPKLVVTAGLHGDEVNGMLAAQAFARQLDVEKLSGAVMIVPVLNPKGALRHRRTFSADDADQVEADLNRLFPGEKGLSHANYFAHQVWHRLLKLNADFAVDLHTQTKGTAYPLFLFADFAVSMAKQMAKAFGGDALVNDPGAEGVLETAWNQVGIPAITVEAGEGKRMDMALVIRVVEGLNRVTVLVGAAGEDCAQLSDKQPEIGNSTYSIKAQQGGFGVPAVAIGDKVEAGQKVAIVYDSFGDQIAEYASEKSGVVVSINTDPIRDRGALLVRLLVAE